MVAVAPARDRIARRRVPRIDPAAWVAPGAVVVGSVRLGRAPASGTARCCGPTRTRSSSAPECNIQDLCCLHVDPGQPVLLEDRVSLGHRAMVHGAHVGAGALIGIGAIVLGGARIGRGHPGGGGRGGAAGPGDPGRGAGRRGAGPRWCAS